MKFQKRTLAFFQIVTKLAEKIYRTMPKYKKVGIVWQDIRGYSATLKAFLLEMKELEVMEYPDTLIDATMALLHNSQLLSVFVTIIFKKTK